jgi:hypothetical protein
LSYLKSCKRPIQIQLEINFLEGSLNQIKEPEDMYEYV